MDVRPFLSIAVETFALLATLGSCVSSEDSLGRFRDPETEAGLQDDNVGGQYGAAGVGGGAAGTGGVSSTPSIGPFDAPQIIPGLVQAGATDDDPSVTADGLELYFGSDREGGAGRGDIWLSRRSTREEPWGEPSNVTAVNSSRVETTPSISPDGLTLYFASGREPPKIGGRDIWMSVRSDRDAAWSAPAHVPELSSAQNDSGPWISADGLTALVTVNFDPPRDADLFLARRATVNDPFDVPQLIAELSSDGVQAAGSLHFQGLLILFAGLDDSGADPDLMFATRTSEDASFDPPLALTDMNSTANDHDPWLLPDGSALYFSSTRTGEKRIYEALLSK